MADKELKDWCKTCSVEPPAMKFKCPECEHNPDKEQIMINGVDVSGCEFYQIEANKLYPKAQYCGSMGNAFCEDNPNCYFKQLARKTQELETICKAFDIEYGYDEETGTIVGRCNKLIEKENELEEYKQSLDEKNKFLQDLGISANGEFKRIKFYIEKLNNANDHYRKALEEIEKVINNILNSCLGRNTVSCRPAHNVCGDLINILDIISKIKDGE